ncbi:MAG: hypothetical protein JSS83_20605 [Cyanobacteria bacterium SZAS LIN-3]|nr:hypothetical protein [Cyanobacteria bacterium SZAS LIN-3]
MTALLIAYIFLSLDRNSHDSPSPIEAAALVAARDIASIVIYDRQFGLVGLGDMRAPLTAWYRAMHPKLLGALRDACAPGGKGITAEGEIVRPTQDAVDAYRARLKFPGIWTTRTLVPGSLKISLIYRSEEKALSEPLFIQVEAVEQEKQTIVTALESAGPKVIRKSIAEIRK